jgi:DNA-binding LacI/PurR family transcriptional regulator
LLAVDFPFVSFGRSNLEWNFHWVDTDGRRGVYEAVQYLIQLGHRQIAMGAGQSPFRVVSGWRLSRRPQRYRNPGSPSYIIRGEHSGHGG